MNETKITTIIDNALNRWSKLNRIPKEVAPEMADSNQAPDEEWRNWHPIESKVNDADIEIFEKRIGYKLPEGYKILLQHKHFYTLYLGEVTFCKHPVDSWRNEQAEMIFGHPADAYLTPKGYIPFADYSDWGTLCFDTNRNKDTNNYPIVLWDHEEPDHVQDAYKDFYNMMLKLEEREKEIHPEN